MIHDQIEKIQAMLETSENIRPETRSELLRLLAGLKADLDQPGKQGVTADTQGAEPVKENGFDGTLDGLRSSVDELESSHPEMVSMVNRLATTLSNMGI